MNAFHRVSESIHFNQEFLDMIEKRRLAQKMDAALLFDLEDWVNGMNSRAFRSVSFWVGLVILILGLLRLLQKSSEMSMKYEKQIQEVEEKETKAKKSSKKKTK
jgi:hypothetical protein